MKKLLFLLLFVVFSFGAKAEFECVNCENLDPSNIKKVYASNPVLLYHLYTVNKNKAVGIVFEFWDIEKEFLDPKFTSLPVVGGFFGQGRTPNIEQVLSLKPDLILASTNTKDYFRDVFQKTKIPILYVDALKIEDSLSAFGILGKYLGEEKRTKELENYANGVFEFAKKVKSKVKSPKSVYYAYGEDGLQTECDGSSFGTIVNLVGAHMAHKCENLKQNSRVGINFEQVLAYQPDAIIVYHKAFYDKIFNDKKWQLLKAVQNKQVFLIPRKPFSWVGKPPSFMRFLGIKWLAKTLYPNETKQIGDMNLHDEAKKFYKLFLYFDLNDAQVKNILNEKN